MTEELKAYEKAIKKKHSFRWTPKYEETFQTKHSCMSFIRVATKVFEALEWDIVFEGDDQIEAKRKSNWNNWEEKITAQYANGQVTVKSVSLGNGIWDNGWNSKRVKLFIYAYLQKEKELTTEDVARLEQEYQDIINWNNYSTPESLPPPQDITPNFLYPLIGGIGSALLLGYLIALASLEGIYVIGLFEVIAALVMGFVLKQTIKLGNYTDFKKLRLLLIGMVVVTYASNQYFQYQILTDRIKYDIGFYYFMALRLKEGFTINSVNLGWIGLLIVGAVQLVLTFIVGFLRLHFALISYLLSRIPAEVADFACYHFVKGKTEEQVRHELEKMGWNTPRSQDEVFDALGAMRGNTELNRME